MGKAPHTGAVDGPVRLAEVLVPLSLVGDLGLGRPMGHAGRTAYLAARLADRAGLSPRERGAAIYVALLRGVGCVADAHDVALEFMTDDIDLKRKGATLHYARPAERRRWMLGAVAVDAPLPTRLAVVVRAVATWRTRVGSYARAFCEVAAVVAERLGLGADVAQPLRATLERWDGGGAPEHLRGEAIPLLARLVDVAVFADTFGSAVGPERAFALAADQAGRMLDPELARAFVALAADGAVWRALEAPSFTAELLALEPEPWRTLDAVDDALVAFADLVDLKSPYTVGHSRGVARLAEEAARRLGLGDGERAGLRRAALAHDLGRVSLPNTILDKAARLNQAEWERVRLHPYYTERVLTLSAPLAPYAPLAGAHHERIDGSGYHRGARAPQLPLAARILAAADTLHAITEARPHRRAQPLSLAIDELRASAAAGKLDQDAAEAVIAAAGGLPATRAAPAALTERELDVLRLVARGRANKEVAATLAISEKTVGHHLEHAYEKLGVSTRAGAVMRALERGVLGDQLTPLGSR